MSGVAEGVEYTPVSGPNGPLTRRYAPTAAKPCRDHSDGAHHFLCRLSAGYGLAGRSDGLVEPIKTDTGCAGLRRHLRRCSIQRQRAPSCAFGAFIGASLDIENYCTLRSKIDLNRKYKNLGYCFFIDLSPSAGTFFSNILK